MWEILRVNPRAFYWSLGLHLFFALLFFVGLDVLKPTLDAGSKARVVQASLVSDRALEALVSDLETGAAGASEGPTPETDTGIETPVPDLPEPELTVPDPTEAERPTQPEPPEPDAAELEAQRLAAEEEARRAAELAAQREAQEAARREAEEAARREVLELEAQRQAELEAQRLAEEQAQARRRAEQEAEARARAEEEARRLAELERQRAEEERLAREARERAEQEARRMEAERERLRQEAERLAAEEAARLEAELERERRQQLAEEAERLAQEEERRLAEDMLQLQLAEEESPVSYDRANQGITEATKAYGERIGLHVEQYWIRPTELNQDVSSEALVLVRLTQSGDVIEARIIQSNGSALFEQSVLAAVNKASPLPVPDGPEFENFRQFRFNFRPRR